MSRMLKGTRAAAVLAAALLACGTAAANDGPSNFIYEAAQSGQDVHLTLGLLHQDSVVSLFREGQDYRKALFKSQDLVDSLVADAYCWHHYGDDCNGEDDGCEDCDGDGVAECWDSCIEVYFVHYVDECVYPGLTHYYLYNGDNWDDDLDFYTSARGLLVDDSGIECDYDLDGAEEGCSTSGLGARSSTGAALALLMLGLGLIAAFARRRP